MNNGKYMPVLLSPEQVPSPPESSTSDEEIEELLSKDHRHMQQLVLEKTMASTTVTRRDPTATASTSIESSTATVINMPTTSINEATPRTVAAQTKAHRANQLKHVHISVDILSGARELVRFLRMVNAAMPALYQRDVVHNAIRRYECYWLPLLAAHDHFDSDQLLPPVDVEWVWQAHILSPLAYRSDCESILGSGKIPQHSIRKTSHIDDLYETSIKLWTKYCGEDEPYDFWTSLKRTNNPGSSGSKSLRMQSIIETNCVQMIAFTQQCLLPHFGSMQFLYAAAGRYQKWLHLQYKFPNDFGAPVGSDIYLMLRSHALHPHNYANDMVDLFGHVLDVPPLAACQRVAHSFEADNASKTPSNIEAIWITEFSPPASVPTNAHDTLWKSGCNFFLQAHSLLDLLHRQYVADIERGLLHIQAVYMVANSTEKRSQVRLRLSYGKTRLTTLDELDIHAMKASGGTTVKFQQIDASMPVCSFQFDRRRQKLFFVDFETSERNSIIQRAVCHSWHACIELEDLLPERHAESNQQHTTISLRPKEELAPNGTTRNNNGATANGVVQKQLTATLHTIVCSTRELTLSRREFLQHSLPDDHVYRELFEFAALDRSAFITAGRTVISASHIVTDTHDNAEYVVQVVHSVPALLTAVLVLRNNHLLAVAHLANTEVLPFRTDVDSDICPSFNDLGERVILVRNRRSYFAALRGSFQYQKAERHDDSIVEAKKKAVSSATEDITGLSVTFYNISKGMIDTFSLPDEIDSTKFVVGDATAKLSGKSIRVESLEVAEHIACVFAVPILFLICVSKCQSVAAAKVPAFVRNASRWPLVLAAGFGCQHTMTSDWSNPDFSNSPRHATGASMSHLNSVNSLLTPRDHELAFETDEEESNDFTLYSNHEGLKVGRESDPDTIELDTIRIDNGRSWIS